jgi:hypothetical protein
VLLSDAFAFSKAGYLDIATTFDLLSYAESGRERDRAPWMVVFSELKRIEQFITNSDFHDLFLVCAFFCYPTNSMFKEFARSLIVRVYDHFGWTPAESHSDRLLQVSL